jgi:seryl-tRNA synthetase
MTDQSNNSGDQAALLVQQLTKALQDTRSDANKQLIELDQKLERLTPKIEQVQRDLLLLQADMRTQFVPRTEYEPRHKVIEEKIAYYDRIILDSRPQQERFIRMESSLNVHDKIFNDHAKLIEELDARQRGAGARIIPIIAAIVSGLALALNFLSHVNFK